MKKLVVMIVAVLMVFGAAAQSKTTTTQSKKTAPTAVNSKQPVKTTKTPAKVDSKVTSTNAKANGLTTITIQTNASRNCKSCINRFKENVPFFKGVKEYTFDPATAKLTVTFDTRRTSADQIRKEISNLGYDADKVKANAEARAKLPACCRNEKCSHHH